jgi:Methyltransferase domain
MRPIAPNLLLTWPILQRMQQIAGWLEPSEADLLLAASARALTTFPGMPLVEIGSYCGRSTVVLGGAVAALDSAAHVFAIDPHEGVVGAMDQSVYVGQPTLEAFQANIARGRPHGHCAHAAPKVD